MKRRYWTAAELRKLRRLYPNMENGEIGKRLRRPWYSVQNKATKLKLRKSPAFMASPVCRIQKGATPWNLGVTGYMGRNRTSFGKGNRPQTWRPIGSERTTRDGTLERKVSDKRTRRDWRPVKDLVWVAANGRIPRGLFVVHKDRNRANFALSNLQLVDRAENMKLNTYHRYPKEIARLIQLKGALQRQINKRDQHEEQDRGSTQSPVRDNREGEGRRHAARPRQGGSRAGAGRHQQRQGGKRLHQGHRRKQGDRLHSGGRREAGASGSARAG